MSHFSMLVFTRKDGKALEALLAPYKESIKYAPYVRYTKEQIIARMRKEMEVYKNTWYARYLKDPDAYEKANTDHLEHIQFLREEFPKRLH